MFFSITSAISVLESMKDYTTKSESDIDEVCYSLLKLEEDFGDTVLISDLPFFTMFSYLGEENTCYLIDQCIITSDNQKLLKLLEEESN